MLNERLYFGKEMSFFSKSDVEFMQSKKNCGILISCTIVKL